VPEEPIRLSKAVAALVPCSRREAEQYITEGWVRVDGVVVEEPQFRVRDERVDVDSRGTLQAPTLATFLVHKPAGMSTAQALASLAPAAHWAGDLSGVRPVKSHRFALAALLELPMPAQGLAVFSQDGRILRKLREDARLIEQELLADVSGAELPGGLDRLRAGLRSNGGTLPPAHVSWQSEGRLRFAVKGIDPDWLPWMCAQVGLKLTALKRLRIGRVPLAGLPPGQWRYLAPAERF